MSYTLSPLCEYGSTTAPGDKLTFSLANRKEGEMADNFIRHVEFNY